MNRASTCCRKAPLKEDAGMTGWPSTLKTGCFFSVRGEGVPPTCRKEPSATVTLIDRVKTVWLPNCLVFGNVLNGSRADILRPPRFGSEIQPCERKRRSLRDLRAGRIVP